MRRAVLAVALAAAAVPAAAAQELRLPQVIEADRATSPEGADGAVPAVPPVESLRPRLDDPPSPAATPPPDPLFSGSPEPISGGTEQNRPR
ncbi:MAG: hypothetical protein PGN34_24865 [Methylobacterium frigidaeris]